MFFRIQHINHHCFKVSLKQFSSVVEQLQLLNQTYYCYQALCMENIILSGKEEQKENFFFDIKHQWKYGVSSFNNIIQVFVCYFTLLGASSRFVISAVLIVSSPLRQRF